jgi:branched-chain amino acid transport system substrate-binding protein
VGCRFAQVGVVLDDKHPHDERLATRPPVYHVPVLTRGPQPLRRIAVLLLGLALVAGCSSPGVPAARQTGPCRYKIAFLGALTGENANIGNAAWKGAKFAIDRLQAGSSSCQVELVGADSRGDPALAPGLARELVADPQVLAVIGPVFSGESEAAVPVFDAGGVTVLTPSATRTSLAEQGWRVFHRLVGNDAAQGPAAGRFIRQTLHARNVFVVNDVGAYGKGLADEVRKELGSLVADNATVRSGQSDFTDLAAAISSSGADVVFYGGYYAEAGPLVKQMRAAGARATFVAGDGVWDPGFVQLAGEKAAEGSVVTCPCMPPQRVKGPFYQGFKAAFGGEPRPYAAEAYDAVQILLSGIEAGNRTRASLLAYVNSYDADGLTGHLKFDSRGERPQNSENVWAYRVIDGQFTADTAIGRD